MARVNGKGLISSDKFEFDRIELAKQVAINSLNAIELYKKENKNEHQWIASEVIDVFIAVCIDMKLFY